MGSLPMESDRTLTLVRCETYNSAEVEAAVRRSVDLLGGMSRFVNSGDRVLVKPNLLSAKTPERRVTTDPEVVRAVARLVLEAGGKPCIGDSPALESLQRVARKTGMKGVAEEMGLHFPLDREEEGVRCR
jgi:uncharacterized protein (DUF362 family)